MFRRLKQVTSLEDQLVNAELASSQRRSVMSQSPLAIGLVALCVIVARETRSRYIAPWAVITALSIVWAYFTVRGWQPDRRQLHRRTTDSQPLALPHFVAGLCWGSFPLVTLTSQISLSGAFACTVAFTLATIKAADASLEPKTMGAYVVPQMMLTAASFVVHDLPMKWLLVTATVMHGWTLWRMYVDSRKTLVESIRTRQRSDQLLSELQEEQQRTTDLMTSLNVVNEQLGKETRRDALTGLVNRVEFNRILDERLAANVPTGVCFIDVDRFKNINDTYGHAAGDELLLAVAQRLLDASTGEDVVARLGGDEFTSILNVSDSRSAVARAENLRTAFATPITIGSNAISVTLSIGVALRRRKENVRGVLSRADHALYDAKTGGRDRVSIDVPTPSHSGNRVEQLTEALGNGSIEMLLQPLFSTTGIAGAEAFARWRQADGTMIDAADFMRFARQGGLEQMVTGRVGRLLSEVAANPTFAGTRLWLNIGAAAIQQAGFAHGLVHLIERAGQLPEQFGIDLTDISVPNGGSVHELVIENVRILRSKGVLVALDDSVLGFGVLETLRHVDVDAIKLDAALTRRIESHLIDRSLVASLVKTAHSLGVLAIAKGVETEGQRDALWEIGIDLQQGWILAKPMSADEIGAQLKEDRKALAAP
jgi:diguanylate cyclase